MISALIHNHNDRERELLISQLKKQIAYLCEEKLKCQSVESSEAVSKLSGILELVDMALLDIVDNTGVTIAEMVRKSWKNSEIMILSNPDVSPMMYLTPSIRAASLFLRPIRIEELERILYLFLKAVLSKRDSEDESSYVVENNDGKVMIPYSKIYYFEVSEKKVYARLKTKEYGQYGTLDQLALELPEQFLRCHRSYIVNTDHIARIRLSEGMIYLDDGIAIPLSRSYKGDLKEYINGVRKHGI